MRQKLDCKSLGVLEMMYQDLEGKVGFAIQGRLEDFRVLISVPGLFHEPTLTAHSSLSPLPVDLGRIEQVLALPQ